MRNACIVGRRNDFRFQYHQKNLNLEGLIASCVDWRQKPEVHDV